MCCPVLREKLTDMDTENAIEINSVSKSFQSGVISGFTFIQDIHSTWERFRGKNDFNNKIVSREELSSEKAKQNERFWALQNVSFSVRKGEVVAVLGRNGAGKSTLLQIISRITEADSGIIRIKGRIASLLGAGVGFNDEMTGRENVYLNGSILGMTPDQISERMNSIAEFAEIPEFLDTPVKRYSSGMRARLGFSVAVHLDSEIMILDEVFVTGDRAFREKCILRMKDLARIGRTILIITHMPQLLEGVCERGIVLRNGNMIFDGQINQAIYLYLNEHIDPVSMESMCSSNSVNEIINRVSDLKLNVVGANNTDGITIERRKDFALEISFKCIVDLNDLEIVVILNSKEHGILNRIVIPIQKNEHLRTGSIVCSTLFIPCLPVGGGIKSIGCAIRVFEYASERSLVAQVREDLYLKKDRLSSIGVIDFDYRSEIEYR